MNDRINALGELSYSSPLIIERRRRILRETRRMIANHGLDGFSIRELCKRSGVAQRTIYNAFGSKEKVIAIAIRQHYDDFASHVRFASDKASLEGALERVIVGNIRSRQVQNYTQAVVAIYFSPNVDPAIREEIRHIALEHLQPWLDLLLAHRRLGREILLDELADTIANIQYVMLMDWCRGLIPPDRVLPRLVEAVLLMLSGAVRGAAKTEVAAYLADLYAQGPLWQALVEASESAATRALASGGHAEPQKAAG
jgi:AcrR family transcriptional regulator